ncbi:MAG TPA: 2-dehydropantoate 2-reductase [Candidatus Hydrogenedentes bacterium]|jgi:2-dehydropantoate 2-reductase|nr:2-dehydropantoate 2-reductase [Candidatus Hydrogenedentota bacterium]NLT62064.1 2-dehydropantoate 2-reductase [Candidatus Hydrogenedentota bacterium]HNZ19264.1 2-dehydropantoate 2-reductase [Candidatus Hydrogenedentota bacterium]HOH34682.1 2-dehydropantoate 2-reductase [Candidatus Hydrogenedentota bacterium]HPA06622.1 2-dehydropantoate 2-reductase [Candidatus Hydrogenedentota bacterium]
MRVLVMGAGALGSAIGGFLAKAGHTVALAGRPAHMEAIARQGLRITGIWGDHCVRNLTVATGVEAFQPGDFDLILITVKSYDTRSAAAAIAPLVDANTLVCSYQNGLGNAEIIAETVGWHRTVGARAIYGVWLPEPGTAEVTVIANPTALGVYSPDAPAGRVRAIAQAMNDAGVPTVYTDTIATVLWGKVAYNCALNPLSALLDVPYGALLDTGHTRAIMRDVVHELYAAGQAMGVRLEPGSPEAYVTLLFEELIPPTAKHYASMREDFRLKRRTEIDALNGAICRYAEARGVPCPANTLLTRLVHAREHQMGVVT